MTTLRINHKAHGHDNTKAARAACRKSMSNVYAVVAKIDSQAVESYVVNFGAPGSIKVTPKPGISQAHCQSCGADDYESLELGD